MTPSGPSIAVQMNEFNSTYVLFLIFDQDQEMTNYNTFILIFYFNHHLRIVLTEKDQIDDQYNPFHHREVAKPYS